MKKKIEFSFHMSKTDSQRLLELHSRGKCLPSEKGLMEGHFSSSAAWESQEMQK